MIGALLEPKFCKWHFFSILLMAKTHEIPLETVKKMSPKTLLGLINKAKEYLKKDPTMQRICEENGVEVDFIDQIPTYFADLDVSARTDHGVVYLNYKLLCDGDFYKDLSYLPHEYTHYFQQCFGDKPTKGSDDGNYLDNEFEQGAFQNQVEFIANEFSEEEAERYVDHLLKHHKITDHKEKKEKKDDLMSLV